MSQFPRLLQAAVAIASVSGLGACSEPVPPPQVRSEAPAVPAQVADNDVSEHVKTAIQQNDLLKAANISVVTVNGDVRLTGVLDTQVQIDEARRIARAAEGAHSIHDELTLKP